MKRKHIKRSAALILAVLSLILMLPLSAAYYDLNGDGVTDTRDIIRLMKYISSDGGTETVDSPDINGDGQIDTRDIIRLMKYIAGDKTPDPAPAPEPKPDDSLTLFAHGNALLSQIVYEWGNSDAADSADRISSALLELTGTSIPTLSSRSASGRTDPEKPEILIGACPRNECGEYPKSLRFGDAGAKVVSDKLIIDSIFDSGIDSITDRLITVLRGCYDGTSGTLTLSGEDTALTVTYDSELSALPVYAAAGMYGYYETGNGCREIVLSAANRDGYEEYLKRVGECGYSPLSREELGKNTVASFAGDGRTAFIGFYPSDRTIKIILERGGENWAEKAEYQRITTQSVTMLGLGTPSTQNGMLFIFRLEDGSFLLYDGGTGTAEAAKQLISTLRDLSSDYARSDSDIVIRAWFITHTHNDHAGLLAKQYDKLGKIKVENVVVSYLSEAERQRAIESQYSYNWDASVTDWNPLVTEAAKKLGATLRTAHTGQRLYFGGAEVTVLHTVEDIAPAVCDHFNSTSIVTRVQLGGSSVLMLGDATGSVLGRCADRYGDMIESDIVQIAHHGYYCNGNDEGRDNAYRMIKPKIVLWPQGLTDYADCRDREYTKLLTSPEQNERIRNVYVAGDIGNRITVPLG